MQSSSSPRQHHWHILALQCPQNRLRPRYLCPSFTRPHSLRSHSCSSTKTNILVTVHHFSFSIHKFSNPPLVAVQPELQQTRQWESLRSQLQRNCLLAACDSQTHSDEGHEAHIRASFPPPWHSMVLLAFFLPLPGGLFIFGHLEEVEYIILPSCISCIFQIKSFLSALFLRADVVYCLFLLSTMFFNMYQLLTGLELHQYVVYLECCKSHANLDHTGSILPLLSSCMVGEDLGGHLGKRYEPSFLAIRGTGNQVPDSRSA